MLGLTRRRRGLRGGCVWLGLTWALAATGCADSQVRSLVRQGDVAGAQAVAAQTKRPLGGRAARALGDRLATKGEYEDARALLAASQARGGASETLRSLAEVEAAMGLDGAAAQRFYLLARRGPRRARESPEGCALLVVRARLRALLGEAVAADADLEAAELLCEGLTAPHTTADVRALRRTIRAEAVEELVARRRPSRCEAGACDAWRTGSWAGGEDGLAGEGPLESLDTVVALLVDELRDRGGVLPRSSSTLLPWLAGVSPAQLERALADLSLPEAAYVRLRASQVTETLSLDPSRRQALSVVLESEASPLAAWRWRWLNGDVGFARLSLMAGLASWMRGRSSADGREVPSAPKLQGRPRISQVAVSPVTLRPLLALGHLLDADGRSGLAVEVRAHVARNLDAVDDQDVSSLLREDTRRLLLEGRPWSALVLLEGLPQRARERFGASVTSWLGLSSILCEDRCGADEDRARVTQVLGEATTGRLAGLLSASGSGVSGPDGGGGDCERTWNDLAGDEGWGIALLRAATGAEEDGALRRMIESDLLLGCRSRLAGQVLAAREGPEALGALIRWRASLPGSTSALSMESEGHLLLAGGRPRRAELRIERAAALSLDPRAVWARAWVAGSVLDAPEFSRRALREIVAYSGDEEAQGARELLRLDPWIRLVRGEDPAPSQEPLGSESSTLPTASGLALGDSRTSSQRLERARALESLLEVDPSRPDGTARWHRVDGLLQTLALLAPDAGVEGRLAAVSELERALELRDHGGAVLRLATPRALWQGGLGAAGPGSICAGPLACVESVIGAADAVEAARAMEALMGTLDATRRRAAVAWMQSQPVDVEGANALFPFAEVNLRIALGLPVRGWAALGGPPLSAAPGSR